MNQTKSIAHGIAGGRYVTLSIRMIRSNEFDDTQSINRHVGQTNNERLYRRISDIPFAQGFLSYEINTNRYYFIYIISVESISLSAECRQHQFAPLVPYSAVVQLNDTHQ